MRRWTVQFVTSGLVATVMGALLLSYASDDAKKESSQPVFGPRTYLRTAGPPNTYDETFAIPAAVRAPYVLRVVNGDPKGKHRVSAATVSLNGVDVLKTKDLSRKVDVVDRSVELLSANVLRVSIASGPGSYLTISVLGVAVPPVPLRLTPDPLTLVVGAQGALTATLTPAPKAPGRLRIASASPLVATVASSIPFAAGQTTVLVPVTAVAPGSSVVTVTINGDRRDGDPRDNDDRDDRGGRNDRDPDDRTASNRDDRGSRADTRADSDQARERRPADRDRDDDRDPRGDDRDTRGDRDDRPVTASATVIVTNGVPPPNSEPTANAGGPYTVTAGQPLTFNGSGSDPDNDPLTYGWTFGDGASGASAAPSHTYASAGDFTATLTVDDGRGGSATATASVTVTPIPPPPNQAPSANAGGPYTITAGQPLTFNGSGSDPDNDPLTYGWTFGDGASGASAAPTHTYAAAGDYSATLTVDDGRGGSATATAIVTVTPIPPPPNQAPSANAGGPYTVMVGQPLTFNGSGSDPDSDPLTFAWTFGDGASEAGAAPSHTYASAGDYSATLTVDDGRGGSATATAIVTVIPIPPPPNQAPSANAGGPYTITAGQPLTLNGSGSDPDSDPLTFTWTFGDGESGAGASPTHTYAAAGDYTATLTVDDGRGGSATAAATVSVSAIPPPPNRAPSANAGGPYTVMVGQPLTFNGSGSDPDSDPLTFAWTFGDGANEAGAAPSHTYASAGDYSATLTVDDGRGGSATATAVVTVTAIPPPPNQAPSANAGGPYTITAGQPLTFNGSGSDPDSDPLTFGWTFGDGESGAGASATHTYASAGEFTATLTVDDGRGGTATAPASVTVVAPAPNRAPSFTSTPVTTGAHQRPYTYQASAIDPDGDALTFALADAPAGMTIGSASGLAAWIPSGPQLGVFNVTLMVADPRGGSSTQSFAITVADATAPVVTLTLPSEALPGAIVTATAMATDNIAVTGLRFEINGADPVDQATAPFQRAIAVPANALAGTEFHVRATARDAAGNAGQADRVFRVAAMPDVQPPTIRLSVPSQGSPGATVWLSATAADNVGVKSVAFRMGDTPILTDSEAPFETTFTVPADAAVGSTVNFSARVFDFSDNFTETVGALLVVATPDTTAPTVQLLVPPTVAEGATATLSATAADNVGVASVSFFVNGVNVGAVASEPYRTLFLLPAGLAGGDVLHVEARAVDFSGLTASSTGAIEVLSNPNRAPTANAGGPYAGEVGELIRLSAVASSDPDAADHLSYDWDFGDQTTGSGLSPSHAYATEGSFTVTVTVSDGRGGAGSSQAMVTVATATDRDPPSVTINGPASVLPGSQVTMTAQATDDRGVAGVAFEVNGGAPTDAPGPPYQQVVDVPSVASPGDRIIVKATARDAAGNRSSAERALTIGSVPDTESPVVAINAPPTTVGGTTMQLSATVSDNVGVQSVSFTVNGVVVAMLPGPPFEAAYPVPENAPAGSSIGVVVQATDFNGNRGEASGVVAVVSSADGDTMPPSITLSAPLQVFAGRTVPLSAQAQDNVGVASVRFFINGVNVATLNGPPFAFTYSLAPSQSAGTVLRVRADVMDLSGLSASDESQTLVVSSASAGQGALTGEVYDDGTGLPLAGASVVLIGTDTTGEAYAASAVSDARGRWVLRATEGQGVVQITKPGWTRVDRSTPIVVNEALELHDARLTLLSAPATSVSAVLGGAVTWPVGPGPPAQLTVPPGALQTATSLSLTPLTQQGLEGLLPAGWSPVAMADITPRDVTFATGATLSLPNALSIADGVTLVVARWDDEAASWRAVGSIVSPASGPLVAEIPRAGQFVFLKPDISPIAPVLASAGDLVEGINLSALALDASTLVDPQPRVLFYRPGVRSDVRGTITAPAPVSSGLPIEARVVESYSFLSGTSVRPESFVEDLVFYQVGGPVSGLGAVFSVTPSQTFDPLTLRQGVITVELLAPPLGPRAVSTLGPDGGSAAAPGGEMLQVPQGAIAETLPVSVRGLTAASFGVTLPPGLSVAGAALVTFSGTLERPATLSAPKPAGLADSTRLLLVRGQEIGGETKLVLVGRGVIVGGHILSDTTLNGADVFEGIRVGGRYFFISAASAFGFARGQVMGLAGGPFADALVSAAGFPVVSLSGSAGGYISAASVGPVALTALDLANADSGAASGEIASAGAVLPLDLQITASLPQVTAVIPADGSANVALSDPIVVRFSKAIAAASINGPNAGNVRLVLPDGTPVSASIGLTGSNSIVTLRPASALTSNTVYTVIVATGVTDLAGRNLAADVTAQFTSLDTQPPPMPPAGSINAAIPAADGFTAITATQGTAATHDTVTVINVTRRTTTPVLLDPNGGFSVRVAAAIGDKLQIAITDVNGNQTVVPLTRFTRTNVDGSVSAFVGAEGGRVEGAGGTAVDVFDGTFPNGAVVTIRPVTEAAFPVQLAPENRTLLGYAGGFELDFDGAIPTRYVNVSVPSAPGDTVNDQWLVGHVVDRDGQLMLNMVDTAKLIGGRVTTSSPPCPGVTAAGVYGVHKSNRPVGLTFGTMAIRQTIGGMLAAADSFAHDFAAWSAGVNLDAVIVTPVCLPVLTGRVTVTSNTVTVGIRAGQVAASDQEIVIKNVALGTVSRFNRDDVSYSVRVAGSTTDPFNVVSVSPADSHPVAFRAFADAPGFVRLDFPLDAITPAVTEIVVSNGPTTLTTFPVAAIEASMVVTGGVLDMYEVNASGPTSVHSLTSVQVTQSQHGPERLVLRALPGTIDPTQAEVDAYNAANPSNPITTNRFRSRVTLWNLTNSSLIEVPADKIINGGFAWAFNGNLSESFRIDVEYVNGDVDFIEIPVFRITVTNAAGTLVKTITLPSPPKDVPLYVGPLVDDGTPPVLTTSLRSLQNFDPSGILTLTFDEFIDRDSIIKNFRVLDAAHQRVDGQIRVSDENKSVTFIPTGGFTLGAQYTIRLVGIEDGYGHAIDPSRHYLLLRTVIPRKVAELRTGTSPVRPLEGLKDIQIQRKTVGANVQTTLVAVTSAPSGVGFKLVTIDVTDPTAPVEKGRESGGATKQRLSVLPGVALPTLVGENPCTSGSHAFTGDLGLTATHNTLFSFVSFYDVTDRDHPCQLGSRLLTANPETLTEFSRRGTIHAVGYAEGLAAIAYAPTVEEPGGGIMAYTAVSPVGIMATRIGRNIPEVLPADRPFNPEPTLPGDYVDVAAVSNRLVALNRGTQQLEIVDPSLSVLAAIDIPDRPRRLLYVPRLPFDADGNGAIGSGEYIDAAIVGGDRSVAVIDLTNIQNPRVVSDVPLPLVSPGTTIGPWQAPVVTDLDVDRGRLRLFATTSTANKWFIVDLGKPQRIGLVDANLDQRDDRIVWSQGSVDALNSLEVDTDTSHIYVGHAKGLDVFNLGAPNLTGVAEFTYFPVNANGINYGAMERRPIRGAIVDLLSGGSIIATTNTDVTGYYSFDAPAGSNVEVVVSAVLGVPGEPTVKVVNNKDADKVWTTSSGEFPMSATLTKDIYAATTVDLGIPVLLYNLRDGAPFAILDSAYKAQKRIKEVDPAATFPLLKMAWSPGNLKASAPDGTRNYADGLIGTSHYSSERGTLYILGQEDVDTDEYDEQVVLHEWAHYFEDKFSRSDTLGGNHARTDWVDPRVAFGEGFATAFASMITNNPHYIDTTGPRQERASASPTSIEDDTVFSTGFYSEQTVIQLLWDLYDEMDIEEDWENRRSLACDCVIDEVQLGFKAIYDAMVGRQKQTGAFTTIFSFLNAVAHSSVVDPAVRSRIAVLADAESIDLDTADEFEMATTLVVNDPTRGSVSVGRLYTDVPPDGSIVDRHGPGPLAGLMLASRDTFDTPSDPIGYGNKLYEQVFFKFNVAVAGDYVVELTTTTADPTHEVLRLRVVVAGEVHQFNDDGVPGPFVSPTLHLQPGTYAASVKPRIYLSRNWVYAPATFTIQLRPAP